MRFRCFTRLADACRARRVIPPRGRRPARDRSREAGAVTLFEVLVVLVILSMVAGLVAPAAFRQLGWARGSVARQSIERLGMILDLYKLDVGTYPTTDQGLQALVRRPGGMVTWNGPYIKGDKVPLDPWNQPYVYRSPSARGGGGYDLCSNGSPEEKQSQATICSE